VVPAAVRNALLDLPGVESVVEYGSSVRPGEAVGDIDVIVVVDNMSRRGQVMHTVEDLSHRARVNVSAAIMTMDGLLKRLDSMPSFGAHLRSEGHVFGHPDSASDVQRVLQRVKITPDTLAAEFRELQDRLDRLSNRTTVADAYITGLGRLYGIGRAAAILQLIALGQEDFSWRTVFKRLGRRKPELRGALDVVVALRPYYEALEGRRTLQLLPKENLEKTYAVALRAVAQLVDRR
jgi:predicted nucleotidyltransferase